MKRAVALPIRRLELGRRDYVEVWRRMQDYTARRGRDGEDQIWFVEHPPVFTLGVAGREQHLLDPGDIPVVRSNRGGQVTYHGPGQLVVYVLLDLRRRLLSVRRLVDCLEGAVIDLLAAHGVEAGARPDAPGVYVAGRKIASLGLRVSRGCSYHGLALNVDMDLTPFTRIEPCGLRGLEVTQLKDLGVHLDPASLRRTLADAFEARLAEAQSAAC